jgi:imidazolonepropionase-like amidohydrolase
MTTLVFSGGDVFDVRARGVSRLDIAVEDGRIAKLGRDLDGDRVIDATGHTILPGLIDCHVHLVMRNTDVWRTAQLAISYVVLETAASLGATLDAGITTVRDAGGADLGVKEAVEHGLVRGPRVQIAITMLSQTGGHADYRLPSGVCAGPLPRLPGTPAAVVDGCDEIRRTVRALVRGGADVIKICATGGVLSPRDDPRHAHFRDSELRVIVEEADAAGLPVMAHALGSAGIKAAVRAGVRSIEHGVYLDDEAVELMLEHGTFLVPTLCAGRGVLRAAEAGVALHESSLRKQRHAIEHHQRSFQRALAAGVPVAMGTDSGVTAHGENLWELELLHEAGMSPADVLLAATRNAARLLGLEEQIGAIDIGKRADLVLVRGDGLDFTRLRERIVAVYKDGVRVAGAEPETSGA